MTINRASIVFKMLVKVLRFIRKEFTTRDSQILFHINEAVRLMEQEYKFSEKEIK